MPSVTNFCSELTGDVLTACKSIPESCVSLNTPPFNQIVGEPELFIRIKKVIQEASLGTHRFFVLGPGRGTTATHEAAKARPPLPHRCLIIPLPHVQTNAACADHHAGLVPLAQASSHSRKTVHWTQVYADGKVLWANRTVLRLLREAS